MGSLATKQRKFFLHTGKPTMGVEVQTIKAGDGQTFANKGDKVIVHYTGTLANGKKFDSSRDRGKPFETLIGVGQVIKGWDEGFTKLSKGEQAKLTTTPDYGYGAAGAGGVITLCITIAKEIDVNPVFS